MYKYWQNFLQIILHSAELQDNVRASQLLSYPPNHNANQASLEEIEIFRLWQGEHLDSIRGLFVAGSEIKDKEGWRYCTSNQLSDVDPEVAPIKPFFGCIIQ